MLINTTSIKKPHFVRTWELWLRCCIHIYLLILITSLVFSNTLDNAYHLDSIYRVENNTEINKFWPPVRFFTDARTGSSIPQIDEYRPMMPLSHAINNEIARATGTNRLAGYHVGNILIHIGSGILAYFLLGFLIKNWRPETNPNKRAVHHSHQAFAAALIFAVHPISGSAVNYIAGRDLLLMVFFLLASLLIYFRMRMHRDTVQGWFFSLLLLSFAILSKPAAILGFAMVFLFEWVLLEKKLWDWRLWARTALFSIPTIAYFLLRWLWVTKQNPDDSLKIPKNIYFPITMAKAHLFYYLRNFAWPFEMRALAKFDLVNNIFDPAALAGVLFIVSTLVMAWLLRKRNPLICFAILAYWLLFSLEGSIFPFKYPVTDYRQYAPFIFLCLIVSLACFSFRRRAISVALLAGMVLYFSISSYQINRHWKTEESFWRQSVLYGGVALSHVNYARQISWRDPGLAEQHYLMALKQDPTNIYANINFGLLYIQQKRPQEGLALLRKMVELNPRWALSHYWLARGLILVHRKSEYLAELRRAADLDHRQLQYQYEAAQALQDARDWAASIPYLERVVNFNPDYDLSGFLLGFAYQELGQNERAIREYERFLVNHPEHVQTHFNLAYALMVENKCDAAIEHFKTVLALQPQYREAHLHLSTCYRAVGDTPRAAENERIYLNGK